MPCFNRFYAGAGPILRGQDLFSPCLLVNERRRPLIARRAAAKVPQRQPMQFPETHWTLIRDAAEAQSDRGRQALDRLLRRYRPVLHWHLTAYRRMSAADADDLLQGFIVNKVLEQQLIGQADPARGRFRSLLLTALDNYRASRHRFEAAAKRSPGQGAHAALEAAEDVAVEDDPAAAFDVRWARCVFDAAAEQMRQACEASGRQDVWTVFSERELEPARSGLEPVSYDDLSRRLGLATSTQAANLLVTAKRMFRREVEQVVGEYAADRRAVEAEVRDLLEIAGRL